MRETRSHHSIQCHRSRRAPGSWIHYISDPVRGDGFSPSAIGPNLVILIVVFFGPANRYPGRVHDDTSAGLKSHVTATTHPAPAAPSALSGRGPAADLPTYLPRSPTELQRYRGTRDPKSALPTMIRSTQIARLDGASSPAPVRISHPFLPNTTALLPHYPRPLTSP